MVTKILIHSCLFKKSAKPIITNHPDRDYLQSIIDGKDTGLEPKRLLLPKFARLYRLQRWQ